MDGETGVNAGCKDNHTAARFVRRDDGVVDCVGIDRYAIAFRAERVDVVRMGARLGRESGGEIYREEKKQRQSFLHCGRTYRSIRTACNRESRGSNDGDIGSASRRSALAVGQWPFTAAATEERHKVEHFFRRLSIRYEKLAITYLNFVRLAAGVHWTIHFLCQYSLASRTRHVRPGDRTA